jgi:translation initiation factor 1
VEPRGPSEHAIRVKTERGGRRGKTVTVCGPFYLEREDALRLLTGLKRECGSGGTVKRDVASTGSAYRTIEIQGDHVERVIERLGCRGFPVRRG